MARVKRVQTFIARLEGPDDSTPVVRAVGDMSHAMGLRVVAEGVSDERLRDAIARLGCDFAQGYFRVRPMPHDQHVDWWRNAPPRAQSLNARGPDAAQQVPASV